MNPGTLKAPIVAALHQLLKPQGFRKSGAVFSRQSHDVIHLIEVQASRTNLTGDARFTVNVGIFAPEVVYPDVGEFRKPSVAAAHWRERIGFLCADQRDLWWSVQTPSEASSAASDLVDKVRLFALPALAALPNMAALVELWKSGRSPGVPAKLRDDFLERLSNAGVRGAA